ncbi:type II toxin-antitoxin system death-on-curing family toxin [Sphingopyxis terrae subsp. ummariensis]
MLLDLEPEVQIQYNINIAKLDDLVRFDRPAISVLDVICAHFLIANYFYLEGYGIGGIGIRDPSLLESAVFRQVSSYDGKQKWNDLFDLVATTMFRIVKNHAFYDGNKRTALLSSLYQLYENGYCPSVDQAQFEDLVVQIAENNLIKYRRYHDLVKSGEPDPEVKFISKWLRDNTRKVDKRTYEITYRELKVILQRFDFELDNVGQNKIDIVKTRKVKKGIIFKKEIEETSKIGTIGFHSWGSKVPHGTVKQARKLTNLTHDDGYDSAAFFKGVDPMQQLIAGYREPLIRLADR